MIQTQRAFKTVFALIMSAMLLDGILTHFILWALPARELNPIFAPLYNRSLTLGTLVRLGLVGASAWCLWRAWCKGTNRRFLSYMLYAFCILEWFVVLFNLTQLVAVTVMWMLL